jgi:hypothetical protein
VIGTFKILICPDGALIDLLDIILKEGMLLQKLIVS